MRNFEITVHRLCFVVSAVSGRMSFVIPQTEQYLFLLITNKKNQLLSTQIRQIYLRHLFSPLIFWSCITGLRVKESSWFFPSHYFIALSLLTQYPCKDCLMSIVGTEQNCKVLSVVLFSLFCVFLPSDLDQVLSILTPLLLSFLHNLHAFLGQHPKDKTIFLSSPTKMLTSWLSNRKSD